MRKEVYVYYCDNALLVSVNLFALEFKPHMFLIRYYTKSEENDHMICSGIESQQLVDRLPLNSDTQIKDMNMEMPLSYENNEIGIDGIIPSKIKKQYGNMNTNYGQYMPAPPIYQQPPQYPLPYSNMYSMNNYQNQNQNQNPYSNYFASNGDGDTSNQQLDPSYSYSNGLAYYPTQQSEQETTTGSGTVSTTTTTKTKSKNSGL